MWLWFWCWWECSAAAEQQRGIEFAAVADGDLLCAVEADGDRLSGLDRTAPSAAGECVLEGAITEIGGGDVGTPWIPADGVGTDEAPGPVVHPGLGRIGEGDVSGEAVPPELPCDLNLERSMDVVEAWIGQRLRLREWFRFRLRFRLRFW